jgi:acetyl esterase/lipase
MPTPSPGANLTFVYVPAQRPASPPPVVIFFHGGGYIDYADEGQLARVLPQFANAAHVVVVQPSYSLDPTFVTQNPPVVVTAARDAGCAVAWAERNIAAWGGDKNRIVLAGDSAGASLAANVGLRTGYVTGAGGSANDPPITGVFGLSGRYDFRALQASYASATVKGKTGLPPYKLELTWPQWFAIHGSGNDPVSAVAPSPYRWRVAYEECDEDGAYRDALEFARLMGASGNALGLFEDRDKYLSAGSQPAPYWHTPAHDAVEPHIAPYSAPSPPGQPGPYHLYAQLAAFAYGAQFPSPSPSWEPVSTKAILPGWVAGSPTSQHWTVGTVGVRDVAVGGDGSVWVVTNDKVGTTNDYAIAQYGNFGDGSVDDACLSVPQRFGAAPPGFDGGGVRVAADASGFPWMLDAAGKLFALPGGLADQGYSSPWLAEGYGELAADVGAGGVAPGIATTHWTLGAPDAEDYPVGSVWIAGRTRGDVWYRDFVHGGFAPAPVQTTGAQRITVDAHGDPYVVLRTGTLAGLDLQQRRPVWNAFSGPTLDAGAGGQLWRTLTDGTIQIYVSSGVWDTEPGAIGNAIASGPTGIPWVTEGETALITKQ